MSPTFPFMTSYDPPGSSEGTLDPLGLYQIADRLATVLVPAVRERMRRIRFFTSMAVGVFITDGLEGRPSTKDADPYIVWEWMVIESLIRSMGDDTAMWGVPGTQMTRRALKQHGYLDARSYLKGPRIFGFHAAYKPLAHHLRLIDTNLGPGIHTEGLVDAWARDRGHDGFRGAKPLLDKWRKALISSLAESPPRTKPRWREEDWQEMAMALAPWQANKGEKTYLKSLLLATNDDHLGALPAIWKLQPSFGKNTPYTEEMLHDRLQELDGRYEPLLHAIRTYERFSRSLQHAFEVLLSEASKHDMQGFEMTKISKDADFKSCVSGLHDKFHHAHRALGAIGIEKVSLQALFGQRFEAFGEPMDAGALALTLCSHHESIQRAKSAAGKRAWFDRMGDDRIYIRQQYRKARPEIQLECYLHAYRGDPIKSFHGDLT